MMYRSWLGISAALVLGSACTIQNYYPAPVGPAPTAPTAVTAPAWSEPEPSTPAPAQNAPVEQAAPAQIVTAPVQTMTPLPRSPGGHILYTQLGMEGTTMVGTGPLIALDPDAPSTRTTVQSLSSRDYVIGTGLIGGYDTVARQFWNLDLQTGITTTIPASQPIDGLTKDGRIVSRCAGGLDEAFALCTYDATGGSRTVVMTEGATSGESTFVVGAGGTRVLGDYAQLTKAPFVFDLATGKRTDLPGLRLADWNYATRPFISTSGRLAAHCIGDKRKSLVVANLDTGTERSFDFGALTRCECQFTPDDRTLACGILPAKPGWAGRPDQLVTIDLASGKHRVLSSTMLYASFVVSADSREIAYVAASTLESVDFRLGVISVTGGATRDLGVWDVTKQLVAWIQ